MTWADTARTLRWVARAPQRRLRRLVAAPQALAACRLAATAEILGEGDFAAGADVVVGRGSWLQVATGHRLSLGDGVWIGNDCDLDASPQIAIGARTSLQNRSQILGDVTIGAGCVGAANLYVSSGTHRFADTPHLPIRVQDAQAAQTRAATGSSGAVRIGDDCWFGINVVVLPGVTIGRGCVIGANAVVNHDLPPYTVAVGAPARAVRSRLRFEPPERIEAGNDEHQPYFYAGLCQLAPAEAGDLACPRVRGGWPADEAFSLALRTERSGTLQLAVDAQVAGRLAHGGASRDIRPGVQTVAFAPRPGRWSVLDFTWHPAEAAAAHALVVLAAGSIDVAGERPATAFDPASDLVDAPARRASAAMEPR